MKLVLSFTQCRQHYTVIWEVVQSLWEKAKPAVLDASFPQSKVQPCLSGVILWKTEASTAEMWTMFDYTALRLPFYTTSSPQNLLLSHCCASFVLYTHWDSSNSSWLFFLLPLAVLLSFSFLLFLDLSSSFSTYSLFNPHNKPFLLYFLLLYLSPSLAFAPLPMPVSVWVLCQPLCQDRSPATPASGGTERETGRAHCHCWTGVVLQLGCNW